MLGAEKIRSDFPILKTRVYGRPLVYLDNAATTQKPRQVLDRILSYYTHQNSNIHRGVHFLSEQASADYESVRETVAAFINARKREEIVFTKGTTESINLVAHSFGQQFVKPGDEILITGMEHHSNIVPWQVLCENKGAVLKSIPVDRQGTLQIEQLDSLISNNTRLLAVTFVSNALGVVNPVAQIIAAAHRRQVPILIDAAQAVQHEQIDVQALDCDFLVFSGHKMYAETGVGVLYGKEKWLDAMPPYQLGGGMIKQVRIDKTTYAELPFKFEAGTGNIAAVISLGAAIEYLQQIGFAAVQQHENNLLHQAAEKLGALPGITLYANEAPNRCGLVSFNLESVHPYDVGMVLDKMGIAVRTGLHCAEPLMDLLGINGTVRASFALYNTTAEIDALVAGVQQAFAMLRAA